MKMKNKTLLAALGPLLAAAYLAYLEFGGELI
jgi:hypothetical protein